MLGEYIKLDLKDQKILAELDFDARISNTELAKRVLLSKKSIEHRISRLESNGIIIGYRPIINFMKLGYYYCRLFIKLQYLTEKIKKDIESYIKENNFANWSIWFRGEYDLGLGIWAKSLKEFKETTMEFNTKFNKYLKEKRSSILIRLDYLPYRFIFDLNTKKEIVMKEEESFIQLDSLDKKILFELTKDARKDSTEIARAIGSNYKTVSYRIKRLFDNKILLGTRAIIEEELLGYTHYKLFLFLKQKNITDIEEIRSYFKEYLGAVSFINEISMADVELEFMAQSNKEFFEFLDDLQNKFPDLITDYDYTIMTKTIKVNFLPGGLLQKNSNSHNKP